MNNMNNSIGPICAKIRHVGLYFAWRLIWLMEVAHLYLSDAHIAKTYNKEDHYLYIHQTSFMNSTEKHARTFWGGKIHRCIVLFRVTQFAIYILALFCTLIFNCCVPSPIKYRWNVHIVEVTVRCLYISFRHVNIYFCSVNRPHTIITYMGSGRGIRTLHDSVWSCMPGRSQYRASMVRFSPRPDFFQPITYMDRTLK